VAAAEKAAVDGAAAEQVAAARASRASVAAAVSVAHSASFIDFLNALHAEAASKPAAPPSTAVASETPPLLRWLVQAAFVLCPAMAHEAAKPAGLAHSLPILHSTRPTASAATRGATSE